MRSSGCFFRGNAIGGSKHWKSELMATILSADHVTKVFSTGRGNDVVAVEDFSLTVDEGEFVCLLGASGCGKSTMLNMFAGFTQPTSGEVRLWGRPITTIEPRCGMVFQSYALFPWKTVRGNVEFGLKMKGVAQNERRARARKFIELVKLQGFEEHYPAELSGGMQQRVTLARLLAADPEVLLMDEPLAALDAMTRQVMQEELLRIHATSRKTTVFITHSIDEAIILSNRIVVMSARPGRVMAILPNDLPSPRHMAVQLSPQYAKLKSELWTLVESEVRRHVDPEPDPSSSPGSSKEKANVEA
jgi:NitT/TauT family transport system ATP-binding protein